jgi:hypothetical protein
MSWADHILPFLFDLRFTGQLPPGFGLLHPFHQDETKVACTKFYRKYYDDEMPRHCIIGINPGRFGAGITGIPFTDPVRLESKLAIPNNWAKKQELSSVFMYEMMEAFGGVEKFYRKFYITAVSPLGFVKDSRNINYYDNKQLQDAVTAFAIDCLKTQLSWGLRTDIAFCLGEGKNYQYISRLNDEFGFFKTIVPLPHPRFIMQYKLKHKAAYIDKYLTAFGAV